VKQIATEQAPSPNGHYSQAIVHDGMVYLSNQLPIIPGSRSVPEGISGQVQQVIANCRAILLEAGSRLEDVLSANVQITDISNWDAVDEVWAKTFGNHRPARSVTVVSSLHLGALVGVQMTAICKP